MPDWSMNEASIRAGHKPYNPDEGWQPARVAPIENLPSSCFAELDVEEYLKDVGKIIYVRPDPDGDRDTCGGRFYEIYKSCLDRLHGGGTPHCCEHQILTD